MRLGRTRVRQLKLWRTKFWRTLNRYRVLLFVVSVPVFVVLLALFLPTGIIFLVSSRSETVRLTVESSQAAAFGLGRARLRLPAADATCLRDALITPPAGASLSIARTGFGRATIVIMPAPGNAPTQVESSQARFAIPPSAGPVILVLDNADPDASCRPEQRVRLPLAGRLDRLGDQPAFIVDARDQTPLLLSADVKMMIRATGLRLNAWLNATGFPSQDEATLAETTELPAGSVLLGAQVGDAASTEWWGFVDIVLGEPLAQGFDVELASYAQAVEALLPSPAGESGIGGGRVLLSLSIPQRCVTDPTIRYLAGLLAVTLLIFEIVKKLCEALSNRREPETPQQTSSRSTP